jgi:hypothetical protein
MDLHVELAAAVRAFLLEKLMVTSEMCMGLVVIAEMIEVSERL